MEAKFGKTVIWFLLIVSPVFAGEMITYGGELDTFLVDIPARFKKGPVFEATAWGAKKDGLTNDQPAIQNAINYAESIGGGTVKLPAGIYAVDTLRMKSNVSLVGDGDSTIIKGLYTSNDIIDSEQLRTVIYAREDSFYTCSASVTVQPDAGDQYVVVNDDSEFKNNNIIWFHSNQNIGSVDYYYKRSFYARLANVKDDTLWLDITIPFDIDSSMTIYKQVNKTGIRVENLKIQLTGKYQVGINYYGVSNSLIKKVSVIGDSSRKGININYSYHCAIDECYVKNCIHPGYGYPIAIGSSNFITVRHCVVDSGVHGIQAGGATPASMHLLYLNNTISNMTDSATDFHGGCFWSVSKGNTATNCGRSFTARGRYQYIEDNKYYGCGTGLVASQSDSLGRDIWVLRNEFWHGPAGGISADKVRNIEIRHNKFRYMNSYVVKLNRAEQVDISGNLFDNNSTWNLYLQGLIDSKICDNTFKGSTYGLVLYNTGNDEKCRRSIINGNVSFLSTYCIVFADTMTSTIVCSDNQSFNYSLYYKSTYADSVAFYDDYDYGQLQTKYSIGRVDIPDDTLLIRAQNGDGLPMTIKNTNSSGYNGVALVLQTDENGRGAGTFTYQNNRTWYLGTPYGDANKNRQFILSVGKSDVSESFLQQIAHADSALLRVEDTGILTLYSKDGNGLPLRIQNTGSSATTGCAIILESDHKNRGAGFFSFHNDTTEWYAGSLYPDMRYWGVGKAYTSNSVFTANSAKRDSALFVIRHNGYVGINKQLPTYQFDLVGHQRISDGKLYFENGSTYIYKDDSDNVAFFDINTGLKTLADLAGDTANDSMLVDNDNDTKIQVEESADEDNIRFDTAGAERMVLNEFGYLGINNNDPSFYLDVNGNQRLRGAFFFYNDSTIIFTHNDSLIFRVYDEDRFKMEPDGDYQVMGDLKANGNDIDLGDSGGFSGMSFSTANTELDFKIDGTEIAQFNSNGQLYVSGTIAADGKAIDIGDAGGFSGMKFNAGSTRLEFWIDGSVVGYIGSDGAYNDNVP